VHLGVLVDRSLHPEKKAIPFQGGEVCVQVWILEIFHASPEPSRAGSALNRSASSIMTRRVFSESQSSSVENGNQRH
jgi:hypothetical protein